MPQKITPFEFTGTPVDNIKNVIKFDSAMFPRSYERIFFKDSLFNYYPYAEIFFMDEVGLIEDTIYFSEGLQWNFKLGSAEEKITRKGKTESLGFLQHNYCWSEDHLEAMSMSSNLSGMQKFVLISAMYMKDDYRSEITWNIKISDVVTKVMKDHYSIDKTKMFISKTSGVDYWPQFSILDRTFIENLSMAAYQESNSPFVSFFNCNGEFYFMSLADMFKQSPIGTYSLKMDKTSITDYWTIKDYKLLKQGLPVNRENYQNTVYSLYQDGSIKTSKEDLKDHYIKQNTKDKFTVRKNVIDEKNKSMSIGLKEDTDRENLLGKINNIFLNSNITNRLELVVRFNPQAVSGKIVNLEIDKMDKSLKMPVFNGNWLICESQHRCGADGVPSTKLVIAKPAIQIPQNNPFFNEFI
jgi:hypothetical protein